MLKILAMAFSLVIFQANPNPKPAQHAHNSQAPPAPVAPAPIKQQESPNLKSEGEKHVKADVRVIETPPKDSYDKSAVWVNGILATIGLIGIGIGIKTLHFLKKQTTHISRQADSMVDQLAEMRNASEIAKAQNKTAKDRERARILIREVWTPILAFKDDTVKPEIPLKITMTVVNDGSTMASNVRAEGHTYFLDYSSIFQDGSIVDVDDDPRDWYRLGIPKIMYPSTHPTLPRPSVQVYVTHMAGVVDEIYEPLDRSLANAIVKGETCIAIRGEISYEDIFGDAHQTPFHLIWIRDALNEDGVWVGSRRVDGAWMDLSAKPA